MQDDHDDIRPEYDFTNAIRGRHRGVFGGDVVMVVREPDVAREFPDAEAVNRGLRLLLAIKEQVLHTA